MERARRRIVIGAAICMLAMGLGTRVASAAGGSSSDPTSKDGAWTPDGVPTPAKVTNGPWTLATGPATLGHQNKGLCDTFPGGKLQPNTATNLMQPYYFPEIKRTGDILDGYFDYRIKDTDEAIAHGTSHDNGLTWSIDNVKLRLNGTCPASDSSVNTANGDNGQGHPFVMTVQTNSGAKTFLYTLDRVSSVADNGGLTIHDITTGFASLKDTEPVTTAQPIPSGVSQTAGLTRPDGILGVVPGTGTDEKTNPTTIMYLAKYKGTSTSPGQGLDTTKLCTDSQSQSFTGKKANYDRVELRLATTTDGIKFTDTGPVSGLNNPNDNASVNGFRFVGPNGTILQQKDGSFGLFFSGGGCQDGDSDAYHFIGYAHSPVGDPTHWTVDNGPTNPFVQVDYTYPTTSPQVHYTGRVYAPQVLVNCDGSATMFFSGYRTGQPLPAIGTHLGSGPGYTPAATDLADYREILVQELERDKWNGQASRHGQQECRAEDRGGMGSD